VLKLEPITLDSLKKEKGFKLNKKHQKELNAMRKKHTKEKQAMQKNHCSAIEKLIKGKEYAENFFLLYLVNEFRCRNLQNSHFFQQKCSGARRQCEESYKRTNGTVVRRDGKTEKRRVGIAEEPNTKLSRRTEEADRDRASYASETIAGET